MIKRLISVGGFTAASRVTGFARDVLMAAIMGAGPISDAFLVAFRLPNNFRAIFGEGAFNAAFLPRFTALRTKQGPAAAQAFANRIFSWQMAAQIVLLVAALAGMRWVIAIMAPGFAAHPGQTELATALARIAFPYLIMTVVAVQVSAMLNAIGKFAAAAAWSIFLNVAMIATLLLATHFRNPAYAAAWGVFLAGILQLLFILWTAARHGLTLRLGRPRWTAEVKEFLLALGAATLGSASVQIGLFIDNLIASFLPSGDLTALYYADRINQLPMGIIGVALGTVLLPEMSAKLAQGDERGASFAQNRAIALGLLLTLPCLAAFFTIPDILMRALFEHGAFDRDAAAASASALVAYGTGLPAFVLIRCIIGSFYARHDTATPVRATLIAVAVNVALKFALVWGLGLGAVGIALGTSLAAWVNLAMLIVLARRGEILVATNELKRAVLPIFAAALAAGAGFYFGALAAGAAMPTEYLRAEAALAGAIICGGAAYGIVVAFARRHLPLGLVGQRIK